MYDYFKKSEPIYFIFPINGDCVNARDGRIDSGTLTLPVSVFAPPHCEVYICGTRATEGDGVYTADVAINGYRNTLVAENRTEGTECRIAVYKMENVINRYRLSSDDNILFLADITKHADTYTSIFDNPYLALYKKAHDLYGAKVHINLFYEFDDLARTLFSSDREYFNLSMMTDKFREEFRENADWLKLAFHAKSEMPDMPYKNTDTKTIRDDCIAVCREIVRFAGPECISDSTTVHWGEANREGVRALRALGFRSLTGYFDLDESDLPYVSYYADRELVLHVHERDFFVDTEEDMIFGKIDRVLNVDTLDSIKEDIPALVNDPHRGGFISVMIHEQYFYSDYEKYLPDFAERVLYACKYLHDHGYTGAHMSEMTAEPHVNEGRSLLPR